MRAIFILLFITVFAGAFEKKSDEANLKSPHPNKTIKTETFTFLSNGEVTGGKIHIPDSYAAYKNLLAIFLIDFTEQHFFNAKDEFEKVVAGVERIQGFDALVITLEEHLNIDANPESFQEYYEMFSNMTSYVKSNYTNNTSRTFIGRGSEAGIVLMTLFFEDSETSVFDNFIVTDPSSSFMDRIISMIENDDFSQNKLSKKLHFSFSISNDRTKCNKLINLVIEAQYPWLQFESIEYINNDYENTYPIAFSDGIKYIFNSNEK